ncbi:MAG: DUF4886 domain-containing protein [Clostridia bacterium]|nr:DUF4886 domain-containing protein [Clostridia bacterium]MBR2296042.1 DUF4886 domain-containing protein [Clostridia bacterium]
MNVLCIGNSFSQDATRYLRQISNDEIYVRNLYIGGCSLETHMNNIKENNAYYEYQLDGEALEMKSINEALTLAQWDFITIQQVSHFSGIEWTYEPFIKYVIDYIKSACPNAKIVFHRTWSYDPKSNHGGFPYYNRDTNLMYEKIVEATSKITSKYSLPIIDNATSIQRARALDEFNEEKGGVSINRDGFHLSLDYGRYLAGLTMYEFFTGKSKKTVAFAPEGTDPAIIEKLKAL